MKNDALPVLKKSFFNRERSWLRFNERVLDEAENRDNPLLERLKFAAIFCNNLDEFFMVRVAGLHRQIEAEVAATGPDGLSPRAQVDLITNETHVLVRRQQEAISEIFSSLAAQGIEVVGIESLEDRDLRYFRRHYEEMIYPVITPAIVGPKHPFPTLQNLNLYLAVRVREARGRPRRGDDARRSVGFVNLPRVLPRFFRLKGSSGSVRFVPIESIVGGMLKELFGGYRIYEQILVRVTRDADFVLDEAATEDMRRAIARKLLGRRHGSAVRVEYGPRKDLRLLGLIRDQLALKEDQFFFHDGNMQAVDLFQIYGALDRPELKYPVVEPISPHVSAGQSARGSIFEWIRKSPRLVHHPYHSFRPVEELVAEAAVDPRVLAIKQTLYRTSGDSPVISGLASAAEAGKSVTAVVELRARFDEERNIEWARRLEKAGVHVVYGLVGFKTHCKVLLVVRRDTDGIRRYVHLGTGNYNDATAKIYTDLGFFTCDRGLGEDASSIFNVITGATVPSPFNRVFMSPDGIRAKVLAMIDREAELSTRRNPGRIMAKMNSLVDQEIIEALYKACRSRVRIDLIIRGICCLCPGIKGLSETIRVISVVGRYLEHSRVFWFANGGRQEVYLSSADWMPRNLDRRIELMFPIESPEHQKYIEEVLELQLSDTVKGKILGSDGDYIRPRARRGRVDSQKEIHALTEKYCLDESETTTERFVPLSRGER